MGCNNGVCHVIEFKSIARGMHLRAQYAGGIRTHVHGLIHHRAGGDLQFTLQHEVFPAGNREPDLLCARGCIEHLHQGLITRRIAQRRPGVEGGDGDIVGAREYRLDRDFRRHIERGDAIA